MFSSPWATLKIWKRLIYVSMFSFTIFYRCSNVCFYVVASIVSKTLPNVSQNVYDWSMILRVHIRFQKRPLLIYDLILKLPFSVDEGLTRSVPKISTFKLLFETSGPWHCHQWMRHNLTLSYGNNLLLIILQIESHQIFPLLFIGPCREIIDAL